MVRHSLTVFLHARILLLLAYFFVTHAGAASATRPTERGLRILSLDGGGVRGIASMNILDQLERHLAEGDTTFRLRDHFDLICGTSTGGLLALGLAFRTGRHIGSKQAAGDIIEVYKTVARRVFRPPKLINCTNWTCSLSDEVDDYLEAAFPVLPFFCGCLSLLWLFFASIRSSGDEASLLPARLLLGSIGVWCCVTTTHEDFFYVQVFYGPVVLLLIGATIVMFLYHRSQNFGSFFWACHIFFFVMNFFAGRFLFWNVKPALPMFLALASSLIALWGLATDGPPLSTSTAKMVKEFEKDGWKTIFLAWYLSFTACALLVSRIIWSLFSLLLPVNTSVAIVVIVLSVLSAFALSSRLCDTLSLFSVVHGFALDGPALPVYRSSVSSLVRCSLAAVHESILLQMCLLLGCITWQFELVSMPLCLLVTSFAAVFGACMSNVNFAELVAFEAAIFDAWVTSPRLMNFFGSFFHLVLFFIFGNNHGRAVGQVQPGAKNNMHRQPVAENKLLWPKIGLILCLVLLLAAAGGFSVSQDPVIRHLQTGYRNHKVFEKILTDFIGEDTALTSFSRSTTSPRVVLVAAQTYHHQPVLFRSFQGPKRKGVRYEENATVLDAARATSAAPLYFSQVQVKEEFYQDGGLVANDPVVICIQEATQQFPGRPVSLVVSVATESEEESANALPRSHLFSGSRFMPLFHLIPDLKDKALFASSWGIQDHVGHLLHTVRPKNHHQVYFRLGPTNVTAAKYPLDAWDEVLLKRLEEVSLGENVIFENIRHRFIEAHKDTLDQCQFNAHDNCKAWESHKKVGANCAVMPREFDQACAGNVEKLIRNVCLNGRDECEGYITRTLGEYCPCGGRSMQNIEDNLKSRGFLVVGAHFQVVANGQIGAVKMKVSSASSEVCQVVDGSRLKSVKPGLCVVALSADEREDGGVKYYAAEVTRAVIVRESDYYVPNVGDSFPKFAGVDQAHLLLRPSSSESSQACMSFQEGSFKFLKRGECPFEFRINEAHATTNFPLKGSVQVIGMQQSIKFTKLVWNGKKRNVPKSDGNLHVPFTANMRIEVAARSFGVKSETDTKLLVHIEPRDAFICTMSSQTVIWLQKKECVLVASQHGNDVYEPASSRTLSFQPVERKAQSVKFLSVKGSSGETKAVSSSSRKPEYEVVVPFVEGKLKMDAKSFDSDGNPTDLTVMFQSVTQDICAVDGAIVKWNKRGDCFVVANQKGDVEFLEARKIDFDCNWWVFDCKSKGAARLLIRPKDEQVFEMMKILGTGQRILASLKPSDRIFVLKHQTGSVDAFTVQGMLSSNLAAEYHSLIPSICRVFSMPGDPTAGYVKVLGSGRCIIYANGPETSKFAALRSNHTLVVKDENVRLGSIYFDIAVSKPT